MNQNLFDSGGHLTGEALRALRDGILPDDGRRRVAAHLGVCPRCADAAARHFENGVLMAVPAGFGEQVHGRLRARRESRVQLLHYSFRVALAACVALILTFSGAFGSAKDPLRRLSTVRPPDFRFIDTVNSDLKDFSQKVIALEVIHHDKETK